MREGWEIKKLREVCKVIAGQSPEGKYYNKDGVGLPFYQGKKLFGEKFVQKPTTWTSKITKEAFANDILMSVRAPVGPVNYSKEKICIGRGLAAIRAGDSIDTNYLFYFLQKYEANIQGNIGAVFNSINKKQIENIAIPIPPLEEQKKIVKVLDEAFTSIEKVKAIFERNMNNANDLQKSLLEKAFSGDLTGKEEKVTV